MTHYDFDTVIDRSDTNALNTDGFRRYIFHADDDRTFAIPDSDFIRMWVADGVCRGAGDPAGHAGPHRPEDLRVYGTVFQ